MPGPFQGPEPLPLLPPVRRLVAVDAEDQGPTRAGPTESRVTLPTKSP